MPEGNKGHRPGMKGGYFPVPPVDAFQDIRSAMCDALEEMGLKVEVHHHEVATGGQCEIGVGAGGLVKKADEVQILKYAIQNVAHSYGKTATFMPKPLVGDNGSGMHVHQSLQKDGKALFAGDKYGGLSDTALYYIGGIIKHAKAINAFTNPGTNSYKRLVPGFEAPVMLAYSARNRSASIRIPWVSNPKARRIEVRFPDSCANPYFAFAAMMMAGLDGIQNKIHPGEPADKDLYDLEPEEAKHIPTVCHSLDMALEHLDKDREFLTRGGVFTNDVIDAYIGLKMQEVTRFRMSHASGRVRDVLQLLRRCVRRGCLGAAQAGMARRSRPPACRPRDSSSGGASGRRRSIMRAAFWLDSGAGAMLRSHEAPALVFMLGRSRPSTAFATTYVRVEKDGTKTYSDQPIRADSPSSCRRRRPTRRRAPRSRLRPAARTAAAAGHAIRSVRELRADAENGRRRSRIPNPCRRRCR